MTTATVLSQPSFLKKNLAFGVTPAILLLIAITALSFGLHFYNIQSIGDANSYYTAAVKSMLGSWRNFFFVAAEPGGSVTVDKPPLGLWIEAFFAYFLGVNGFTTSLPNILAGVFGIPILYVIVKKYAGELAGLVAAFVMATTPIYLATNRNNTMDGLLVFFLLLAAWAFMQATETGKLSWVLLGAFIIGLGFNIKMAQALLPLPAFYALYFFGSKESWIRKALNLGEATILLVAVSLSWAVVVDLTPAGQRPYIGLSRNNTALNLILEHNACANPTPDSPCLYIPAGSKNMPFRNEIGNPGIFRFFTSPLSKQMSWLLPFALISIVLSIFAAKIQLPVESGIHKMLILWGGWLLTCVVFFSIISGIFHAYYAIMLVPPLGAMVGVGFALLWAWSDKVWATITLITSALITLAFQAFAVFQYGEKSLWMFGSATLFGAGIMLAGWRKRGAYALIFSALLVIPMYWTVMTVISNADHNLPTAYMGRSEENRPPRDESIDEKFLNELQANTQGMKYLVAVPSSQQGAQLVIATGRPVLYMGGFAGQDAVVDADDLKLMVANGELRYILYGGERGNREDISNWLQSACVNMIDFIQMDNSRPPPPNAPQDVELKPMFLYRCE